MPLQRTAKISMDIVIVSGSHIISTLACAYTLQMGGHRVRVLEKRSKKSKIKGSARCPPNMTRLLKRWPGTLELLERMGTKLPSLVFKGENSSETVGGMVFHEDVMRDLDGNFFLMKNSDVCEHFQALCDKEGVVFEFDSVVTKVDTSPADHAIVHTKNGSYCVDLVVVGDGENHDLRKLVAEEDLKAISVHPALGVSVPTAKMKNNPALLSLCESNDATIWLGDTSCIFGGLDNNKNNYHLGFVFPASSPEFDKQEWCSKDLSDFNFEIYEPRIQQLILLADEHHLSTQNVYPFDKLSDPSSRVVLVGDAAHCTLTEGSQHSSMAIEDAVTLGNLLSRLTDSSQLPTALHGYSDIRLERTKMADKSEFESAEMIMMPPGPQRDDRNIALRATMDLMFADSWDEEDEFRLAHTWQAYLAMFDYDATDSVDEWAIHRRHFIDESGYFVL